VHLARRRVRLPRGGLAWADVVVRAVTRLITLVVAVLATCYVCLPHADARDHRLGTDSGSATYPWAQQPDPGAMDIWGFMERQCTSYAAWYLNMHGVPFAARTRGPAGVAFFLSADQWDRAAAVAGFPVRVTPVVGSIAEWHAGEASPSSAWAGSDVESYPPYVDALDLVAGSHGHVAVVEAVLGDGSVLVSEYDGEDRRFHLLRTRAPRYLYIGAPREAMTLSTTELPDPQ
jgi:surface antigen